MTPSALEEIFSELDVETPSCVYLPLTDVIPCMGIHGRYVKLICLDGNDLPIEVYADSRHFSLLEPYVDELRTYRQTDSGSGYPQVPAFKGNDNRWRFSWRAASQDNPHIPETPTPESVKPERAYRMQVSVPHSVFERFRLVAAERGQTHTDLLLTLIAQTVA